MTNKQDKETKQSNSEEQSKSKVDIRALFPI